MKKTLLILLSIFFIFNKTCFIYADDQEEETDYIWLYEEINDASINNDKEPIFNSKYICVLDTYSNEILYGKNENIKTPMASTTKIMTAIVLMESLEKNGLNLDSQIEVCNQAAMIQGSRLGLKKKDKITINDLLYGLMLCSRK